MYSICFQNRPYQFRYWRSTAVVIFARIMSRCECFWRNACLSCIVRWFDQMKTASSKTCREFRSLNSALQKLLTKLAIVFCSIYSVVLSLFITGAMCYKYDTFGSSCYPRKGTVLKLQLNDFHEIYNSTTSSSVVARSRVTDFLLMRQNKNIHR